MNINTQVNKFAGKRYTIDTFPENPEGETHDLALLKLDHERFQLEGEVYGVDYPPSSGSYEIEDGYLKLDLDDEHLPDMNIKLGKNSNNPEHFWPGRDIDIEGLPQWEGRQITFHRVPDPQQFDAPLSHHEHNLVGEHSFESPRMGEFRMKLRDDRSGYVVGHLQGKPVIWQGKWLSTHPMSYFVINGSHDFLAWHNNHDHGNHDTPPEQMDPIQDIKNMPVDVITTTTGEDADIRKVYGMVMNPQQEQEDGHHHDH